MSISLSYEVLNLETKHSFGIAYGSTSTRKNVLVTLTYGDCIGLGEAAPASYHGETINTVFSVLEKFKQELILGDDPFAITLISQRMDKLISGNYAAKAALEIALHDLCGNLLKTPSQKLLGLSGLSAPMTDFTIGIDSLEMLELKTQEALEFGYKILKVKQGTTYDKEIILGIRKVAPDVTLRVDANGSWTPKQAISMSKFLAEQGVEFMEQPLAKFASPEDWKLVREHSAIPVFADESCGTSKDIQKLAGNVDGIVVKLSKTGGLLEALRVISCARSCEMKVMLGCMIESSLGITAAAQLAVLADYLDLDGAMLLKDDPYCGAEYKDGYLILPKGPGLGVRKRS